MIFFKLGFRELRLTPTIQTQFILPPGTMMRGIPIVSEFLNPQTEVQAGQQPGLGRIKPIYQACLMKL